MECSFTSVGDDDRLFTTRLFNATPRIIGQEPPRVKRTRKPCLISFDLIPQSFGDGLIHERLSVFLSLNANDMLEICSNMCFMLKPDSALPIKESAVSLSTADNDPGYHPTNIKNPVNVSFIHDDFIASGRRSLSSSRSTSSPSRTSRRCASRRASGSSATC